MNRLTTNSDITGLPMPKALQESCGEDSCEDTCDMYSDNGCVGCPIQKCMTKLSEFEDLEEQGRLIVLPCKIGEEVWVIHRIAKSVPFIEKMYFHIGLYKYIGESVFTEQIDAQRALREIYKTMGLVKE